MFFRAYLSRRRPSLPALTISCAMFALLTPADSIASDDVASAVYRLAAPSVVMIETYPAIFRGTDALRAHSAILQGSGVVIGNGVVLSNCHVLAPGLFWKVTHGDREYEDAKIIDIDLERDLCTISVNGLKAPIVRQHAGLPLIGEHVYSIGAPQGLELTIAEGIVSGLRKQASGTVLQTSAPISPGSSGGGLFDESGALVGITTFHIMGGNDLNFALPTSWILDLPARSTEFRAKRMADSQKYQVPCMSAMRSSKWNVAEGVGREWTAHQPYDARAWSCLGEATVFSDFKRSVSAFGKSLWLSPTVDTYTDLVRAYGMKTLLLVSQKVTVPADYYERAVQAFSAATAIDPENVEPWIEIAKIANVASKLHDAVGYSKRAIQLDPNSGDAWSELADAYNQLGRPNEAVSAARRAIALNPDSDAWGVMESAATALGDNGLAKFAHNKQEAFLNKMAEDARRDASHPN
jgi:Trypsin-like peptidase domain/Tetratricopeptide repeat